MNNMNMRKYQEQYEVAFTGFFYKMKSFDSSKSTVKLVEAFKQKKNCRIACKRIHITLNHVASQLSRSIGPAPLSCDLLSRKHHEKGSKSMHITLPKNRESQRVVELCFFY